MPQAIQFLEQLPQQLSATVQVVPEVNRSLMQLSLQRLLNPKTGLREQLVLRHYALDFRFGINKSSTGQLFFFFNRKKRSTEVVMDVKVAMTAQPVPEMRSIAEQDALPLAFRWQLPPFLVVDPQQRQLLFDAIDSINTETSVILIDSENQPLIVDLIKDKEKPKARIWFKGEEIDENQHWPAQPFFTIYQSVRQWLEGDWKSQMKVPLILDQQNEVSQIIQSIAQAYRSARKALSKQLDDSRATGTLLNLAVPDYDLIDYRSDILLRLNEEGNLALFNSRETFQFGLDIALTEKSKHYEALLSMHIPDFLVSGALFEKFWNLFLEGSEALEYRDKLLKLLEKRGYSFDQIELVYLLKRGREGYGSVIRIDREQKMDINIFIVSGIVRQEKVHLVFSGKFQVISVKPPQIELKSKDSLDVHYYPEKKQIDKRLVNYFLRMIKYFKTWVDIL